MESSMSHHHPTTMNPLTPPTKLAGEDILLCVDVGPESAAEMKVAASGGGGGLAGGVPYPRLEGIKQAILLFVNAKLSINPDHRFAYAALANTAGWIKKEFSSDVDAALAMARTLRIDPTSDRADVTQLFKSAAIEAKKSRSQGRILRVILFYCRSAMPPEFERLPKLQKLFTLDVIYLHDKPVPDKNCPQKVYDTLVDALEYFSEYEGYIYESGQGLTRILFRYMCVLLSHAQQRCTQDDNDIPKSLTSKKLQSTDIVLVEEAVPMSS
ncbi:hypothetical protein Leryth_000579 [Lithospermum erythrorhizon]|nr:hypothetical protein Leryth_000579 [Lithospermum erythrorhizon]